MTASVERPLADLVVEQKLGVIAVVVVAWLSCSALFSISKVTLSRARLLLGWVTACGRVNHLSL